MRKLALIFPALCTLTGCVSDQEYRAAQASCERPGATHLAVAKCQNAVMYSTYSNSRDRDLQEVMAATRELVAAKLDRHEITEEEGRLQVAQAKAQLTSEREHRNLGEAAVLAASTPAPAPYVAPQMPHPLNCTSTGFGNMVQTHCF